MTFKITSKHGVVAAKGFKVSAVSAGLKKPGENDMALLVSECPAHAAGIFTTNRLPAAPVQVSREHLHSSPVHRAVLLNAGSANACTGPAGRKDASRLCAGVAESIGGQAREVLAASTGVIGTRLPVDRMLGALPQAVSRLSRKNGLEAARSIMTTDTIPKQAETSVMIQGTRVRIGGMAKGSGMIHPNMATMLAVITTDMRIGRRDLHACLKTACAGSFNAISIDGQTSTNDTVFLLANGAAGLSTGLLGLSAGRTFLEALTEVMDALARSLIYDGEGAGKFIEILVKGGCSDSEAMVAARAIGDSLLVKTAIHGEDANWGRILQALGAAEIKQAPNKIKVNINQVPLVSRGVDAGIPWAQANRALRSRQINITVELGMGRGRARYRTCDLTAKYVAINAAYRS